MTSFQTDRHHGALPRPRLAGRSGGQGSRPLPGNHKLRADARGTRQYGNGHVLPAYRRRRAHGHQVPPQRQGDGKGYNCTDFTSGQISSCNNGKALPYCAVTVLDHFTSSFHWAETNFSAIWLRPQWYLVDNSVLTDVQNGGLSFITSGTYDRSAVVEGDWAVVRTSVFVGNTQKEGTNSFASNLTPFQHTLKPGDGLPCGNGNQPSLMCASTARRRQLSDEQFRGQPAPLQHL